MVSNAYFLAKFRFDTAENESAKNVQNFAKIWQARSRLYQNEILQENMRLTAFVKLYKICKLLHRYNLNILTRNLVTTVALTSEVTNLEDVLSSRALLERKSEKTKYGWKFSESLHALVQDRETVQT